jgi:hypothetical protein
MKKSVLIIFSFLLVSSISALYIDDYNNYNFYNSNNFIINEHRQNSKTFLIKEDNGNSYYRTFINYNKYRKYYDSSKTDFERRSIYLDFFDTKNLKSKDSEIKKEINCPEGWTCEK